MSDNIRNQKIEEINQIRKLGINPFPAKFERTHTSQELIDEFSDISAGETREQNILKICGRVVALRDHGKSSFFVLKDYYGKVQVYIRKKEIGEEKFEFFKKFVSIGDFVGITGFPFRSHTGELTVFTNEIILLSKSIRTMPEKFHGIKDKEIIYRQRYVDLISNEESFNRFKIRFRAIQLIREFMNGRKFVEVETPMLHYISGGATARPFVTHLNAFDIDMYMRIAPELYLKRLIVGGFDRVYEINRNFRNEGVSYKHSPEFTMMESYQAFADFNDVMELTESLLSSVTKEIHGTYKILYQGQEIDFTPPWKRVRMDEFIKEHLGVDITNDSDEVLCSKLKEKGALPVIQDKAHFIEALWDLVEDKIIQPTFITHHLVEISPLSKRDPNDPRVTERFELIIFGREMANAFSELNDPIDQRERFEKQVEMRDSGDEEAQMMDLDFLRALEYGLPPTGGLGIGIDRFVMFLTDAPSIRDVIPFPIVKPDTLFDEFGEESQEEIKEEESKNKE